MENDFRKYYCMLNKDGVYPDYYLRRNHKFYPLVCYINNIICFHISENYSRIPLFICRAYKIIQKDEHEHSANKKTTDALSEEYKKIVLIFLKKMATYISLQNIEKEEKDLIPVDLL